jgi:hypothetical protein
VQVLWRRERASRPRSEPAFWHELLTYGASPDEFIPLPL